MPNKRHIPIYPWLLLTHFFLHLYASNLQKGLTLSQCFMPYGISFTLVTFVWLLLLLICHDAAGASFITAIGTLLFFSFGHIHEFINQHFFFHYHFLLSFFALAFVAGIWFALRNKELLHRATNYLNIFAIFLALLPFLDITAYHWKESPYFSMSKKSSQSITNQAVPDADRKNGPDIYYLILDEYPRDDVLRDIFHYDNSPFTDFLSQRGFYIARQSCTNYTRTALSLASSVNMRYLNDPAHPSHIDPKILAPLSTLIQYQKVADRLQSYGYQFITMDSGVGPTNQSPIANRWISFKGVDEFDLLLFNSTMLKVFGTKQISKSGRGRHLYNLRELSKVPEMPGQKYVFAHILLPHPPFVFNRTGGITETYEIKMTPDRGRYLPPDPKYQELFLNQLIYTNEMVKKLIDSLLLKSRTPPIIVLQSDHGSWPSSEWALNEDWLRERMPILNAFYLPGPGKEKLYPTITPVNTFRLIFDAYFQTQMGLLKDRMYYSHPYDKPCEFTDVTEILLNPRGAAGKASAKSL